MRSARDLVVTPAEAGVSGGESIPPDQVPAFAGMT